MKLGAVFTAHPASVGESYGRHFLSAVGFVARLHERMIVARGGGDVRVTTIV